MARSVWCDEGGPPCQGLARVTPAASLALWAVLESGCPGVGPAHQLQISAQLSLFLKTEPGARHANPLQRGHLLNNTLRCASEHTLPTCAARILHLKRCEQLGERMLYFNANVFCFFFFLYGHRLFLFPLELTVFQGEGEKKVFLPFSI